MTKRTWTVGLGSLEKEAEMEQIYHEALVFRQRLALLINKRIDSNRSSLIARKQYDSPNWPYLQSDGIGYERAMNEILNLVGSKNVSNNEDD
jgi:hypothetical protein